MAIQLHEKEIRQEDSLYNLVLSFPSHVDKVKFALFAAKDCFYLCNEQSKPFVQKCIQLVESWLNNPASVSKKQWKDALNYIAFFNEEDNHTIYHAIRTSYKTVSVVLNPTKSSKNLSNDSSHLVVSAVSSSLYARTNDDDRPTYPQYTEYNNYAYSILRSTNIVPSNVKGTITDKTTLMALLDELHELNEDLIIHKDNQFVLNHPTLITTNALPELVDKIWEDKSLLHYVERLYR